MLHDDELNMMLMMHNKINYVEYNFPSQYSCKPTNQLVGSQLTKHLLNTYLESISRFSYLAFYYLFYYYMGQLNIAQATN